ncbi:MAG: hypothetical protein GX616_11560 [Planctomycetes bacterium]|nr:hypothetical protein [Planctomycetota bacterium]
MSPATLPVVAYRSMTFILAAVAVGFVFWRAWVCDDAFITFRHVANCLDGHGPVFNPGERVQGYTHPLWFLVLLVGSTLFEPHPLAMVLGLVSTLSLMLLLGRFFRSRRHNRLCLLAVAAMLLSSPTFIEYQTSGLETCLTHLLVVLLWGWLIGFASVSHNDLPSIDQVDCLSPHPDGRSSSPPLDKGGQGGVPAPDRWPQNPFWGLLAGGFRSSLSRMRKGFRKEERLGTARAAQRSAASQSSDSEPSEKRIGASPSPAGIVLLCSLLMLNRPDHLVPCVPFFLLALHLLRGRSRRAWLLSFAALLPLLAWYGFATVYYGSPLPNTAYAKTGMPLGATVLHGLAYLRNYGANEPIHGLIIPIVLLIQTVIAVRDFRAKRPGGRVRLALVVAVWLHVGYVVMVGGDFMRGRFLSLRLVVTAVFAGDLVGRLSPQRSWKGAFSVALFAGLAWSIGRAARQYASSQMIGPPGVYPILAIIFLLIAALGGIVAIVSLIRHRPLAPGPSASILVLAAAGLCTLFDFKPRTTLMAIDGIADEYAWYAGTWRESRFARPAHYPDEGVNDWVRLGRSANRYASRYGPIAIAWDTTGFLGHLAGPQVQIIDNLGLTDPFIARLPANPESRIGHLLHEIPKEYMRSRMVINELPDWRRRLDEGDPTLIADARALPPTDPWTDTHLEQRWKEIQTITKDPLFSAERWRLIPRYARGR